MVGKTRSWTDGEEPPSVFAELEAMRRVLGSLERLTLEVSRRVAALEAQENEVHDGPRRESKGGEEELAIGDSVRVVRRDPYYGRVGKVVGRRGRYYWDVRLDDRPGSEVIYKKGSGLAKVERSELVD